MIPARKSRAFTRWFAWTCERRIRRTFDVYVHGLSEIVEVARAHPIVLVSNHTSWWDPLVALVICRRVLGLDAFALMEEANLERLRFFGLAGAIGLRRGDPRDGAKAVRHAARVLDRSGRALWVFAQGEERPPTEALRLHGGAARIAGIAGATMVPIAIRYVFGARERPELWIVCGTPVASTAENATELLATQITAALARIDRRSLVGIVLWSKSVGRFASLATAALDRIAALWLALHGDRLEATIGAEPQRAIRPAHAPPAEGPNERREQHEIRG